MILPITIALFALQAVGGQETTDPRCASVSCPVGYKCIIYEANCKKPPCPLTRPVCAPNDPKNPCADHPCLYGQVCENVQVQCFVPPCYPIPECRDSSATSQPGQKCSLHEHFNSCTGCDNTCENRLVACPAICKAPGACRCNQGFYRHKNGSCVTADVCEQKH